MGKGGTKYVGDALGARAGRPSNPGRQRQKELTTFLATGRHPLGESKYSYYTPLPESKKTRVHVYLDFAYAGKNVGRIVIELYDDVIPSATNLFVSRCISGAEDPLLHTRVHRILRGLSVQGGRRDGRGGEHIQIRREDSLRHVDKGLLSLGLDGKTYCLTLAKALTLDEEYQVIGKIVKGIEGLEMMCELPAKADDSPSRALEVVKCGITDVTGEKEFDTCGRTSESDGNKNADALVEKAKRGVQDALRVGLSKKRKQEEEGNAKEGSKMVKHKAIFDDDDDDVDGDSASDDDDE